MSTKNKRSSLPRRFILNFLIPPFCIGLLLTNSVYAKSSYNTADSMVLFQTTNAETDAASSLKRLCHLVADQDLQRSFPKRHEQSNDNHKEDLTQHEPYLKELQLYSCTSEDGTENTFYHIYRIEQYVEEASELEQDPDVNTQDKDSNVTALKNKAHEHNRKIRRRPKSTAESIDNLDVKGLRGGPVDRNNNAAEQSISTDHSSKAITHVEEETHALDGESDDGNALD